MIYYAEYTPSIGSLFLAKFSEFEIEGHENANDIDEHRKERTRKAHNPRN